MRFFVFFGMVFPFAMTALGAAVVFLFRKSVSARAQRVCLGFAAGVMLAAAVFSLLLPAMEQTEQAGGVPWLTAAVGFLIGGGAMIALDIGISGLLPAQTVRARRHTLLFSAVTLHNIPEGLAVGVALAAAISGAGSGAAAFAAALGIGLQNLPEGAAIALPLRQGGMSRMRSFGLGVLSGAVEPAAAAALLLAAANIAAAMPWLMAIAAGSMALVAFSELLPSAAAGRDGVLAALLGFALMMALDVALG